MPLERSRLVVGIAGFVALAGRADILVDLAQVVEPADDQRGLGALPLKAQLVSQVLKRQRYSLGVVVQPTGIAAVVFGGGRGREKALCLQPCHEVVVLVDDCRGVLPEVVDSLGIGHDAVILPVDLSEIMLTRPADPPCACRRGTYRAPRRGRRAGTSASPARTA